MERELFISTSSYRKQKKESVKKAIIISVICVAVLAGVGRFLVSNVYGADKIIKPVSITSQQSEKNS